MRQRQLWLLIVRYHPVIDNELRKPNGGFRAFVKVPGTTDINAKPTQEVRDACGATVMV
ncbi:hypothetical protein GCM10010862_47540 [Devosia nitrariae]|uniref:Uncharacterized protein n=1 Tax=Devosia nitrariae TaxID=2071872 RepID=A0ABQ5WC17_9HYPH|nr:hypothetical protein GCM10010862_47540 [Devosia nitrariae]